MNEKGGCVRTSKLFSTASFDIFLRKTILARKSIFIDHYHFKIITSNRDLGRLYVKNISKQSLLLGIFSGKMRLVFLHLRNISGEA